MDQQEYDEAMQKELQGRDNQNAQFGNTAGSMFAANQDPNLIEYQLDMDNILERIEHLLKGEKLVVKKGVASYEAAAEDERVFNEYGVQFLMNIMSFYLNRNTVLSNYSEERIYQILFDLGNELTDQIFLSYKKMGMNTREKKKRYSIIVLELIHTVESAYNRALQGGERESLRTARMVTQNADPSMRMQQPIAPTQKRSIFKPSTWVGK